MESSTALGALPPNGAIPGRGVVYLGHIPHGFYEKEMKSYFSQFGEVTRLRLARSKKTGGSKGYAFIEFLYEEVAKVAADAMNNYLMFNKLLKCKVIPPHDVHQDLFKNWNRPLVKSKATERQIASRNKMKSDQEVQKDLTAVLDKNELRNRKLKAMGINYKFNIVQQSTDTSEVEDELMASPPTSLSSDNSNLPVDSAKWRSRKKKLDTREDLVSDDSADMEETKIKKQKGIDDIELNRKRTVKPAHKKTKKVSVKPMKVV